MLFPYPVMGMCSGVFVPEFLCSWRLRNKGMRECKFYIGKRNTKKCSALSRPFPQAKLTSWPLGSKMVTHTHLLSAMCDHGAGVGGAGTWWWGGDLSPSPPPGDPFLAFFCKHVKDEKGNSEQEAKCSECGVLWWVCWVCCGECVVVSVLRLVCWG